MSPGLRPKRWLTPVVVAISVFLVVVVGGYLLTKSLGLDGALLAALASAAAAFISLFSATASSSAAQDAARAAALAQKPGVVIEMHEVHLDGEGPQLRIVVSNAIASAELDWVLRDGSKGRKTLGHLNGTAASLSFMGTPSTSYEPVLISRPGDGKSGTDTFHVRYSGLGQSVFWQLTRSFTTTYNADNNASPWETVPSEPFETELR